MRHYMCAVDEHKSTCAGEMVQDAVGEMVWSAVGGRGIQLEVEASAGSC